MTLSDEQAKTFIAQAEALSQRIFAEIEDAGVDHARDLAEQAGKLLAVFAGELAG